MKQTLEIAEADHVRSLRAWTSSGDERRTSAWSKRMASLLASQVLLTGLAPVLFPAIATAQSRAETKAVNRVQPPFERGVWGFR